MPGPVSVDLRRRVVEAYKRKEGSQRKLAKRFAVSASSIVRWISQESETGSLAPSGAPRGPKPKIDDAGRAALDAMLEEQGDLTNEELADQLEARGIVKVSASSVSRALTRMGWTRKQNAAGSRTRHPPDPGSSGDLPPLDDPT